MANINYDDAVKGVYRGLGILAVVTLIEVFVSLSAKGYLFEGAENWTPILYIAGLAMIALSLYKAKYIIFEFMHMAHEVKGLRLSVLLPTALLIWGAIAFFQEGGSWKSRRSQIKEKNAKEVKPTYYEIDQTGMLEENSDIIRF